MADFQDLLKKVLFEAEGDVDPAVGGDPTIPAGKYGNMGSHEKFMGNEKNAADKPIEMLSRHLAASQAEFAKLKQSYMELVEIMKGLGQYGAEDKNFMKGQLTPMSMPQQGQPTAQSNADAMQRAAAFRQRMQQPVTPNFDD